jgi:hypothetical protein
MAVVIMTSSTVIMMISDLVPGLHNEPDTHVSSRVPDEAGHKPGQLHTQSAFDGLKLAWVSYIAMWE